MEQAWASVDGSPWPLGASWNQSDAAYNFALYAKDATSVSLLLYGGEEYATPLVVLPFTIPKNRTGRVCHMRVAREAAAQATHYAYQVDGPNTAGSGTRFDAEKILLDPYARGVFFPPGFTRAAACAPGSNAGKAPIAVLPPASEIRVKAATPDPRHDHDLVVYEMHVRGFTQRANSGVSDDKRGPTRASSRRFPISSSSELPPLNSFRCTNLIHAKGTIGAI
jgi:glycogen operon protein